jgi:CRISPR/Cas system CSM-associated protein Csm2 small subunit
VTGTRILLDEHVGRVFERVLGERGYEVEQAKDVFGELTEDAELLAWCGEHGVALMTNNARDFEELHREIDHAGLLLYYDQKRPDEDPEGLARVVDEVFTQYGATDIENEVVDLDEWYDWLHG